MRNSELPQNIDIAITRGGASTLSELSYLNISWNFSEKDFFASNWILKKSKGWILPLNVRSWDLNCKNGLVNDEFLVNQLFPDALNLIFGSWDPKIKFQPGDLNFEFIPNRFGELVIPAKVVPPFIE